MMIHDTLYVLPDGTTKSSGSYSARSDFKFCRRFFYLKRVKGWKSRRNGAALDFGKAVEAAVQYHIQHGGQGGREEFSRLWNEFKASKDFAKKVYAKAEVSWENCLRIGDEWMQIFALRFKTYPLKLIPQFQGAEFQVPLRKKIFPNTSYGNITSIAYLDILSKSPGQPSLIIDVKTASKELNPSMVGLDPQLIEYAWIYHNPDVAFLWFVKKSHGFKFKSRVTLLQDCSPFHAGDEVYVLEKMGTDLWISTLKNCLAYEKAYTGPDGKDVNGKAATTVSTDFFAKGYAIRVSQAAVSKQLVQFAAARIPQSTMDDMGKVIGQLTVEMVMAHEQQFYPMEPGLRYPSEKCPRCDMRYICMGDDAGRDKNLVREGAEPMDGDQEDLGEVNG
jgi:hypothetical protein